MDGNSQKRAYMEKDGRGLHPGVDGDRLRKKKMFEKKRPCIFNMSKDSRRRRIRIESFMLFMRKRKKKVFKYKGI